MTEPLSSREFNRKLQAIMVGMKDVVRLEEALKSLAKGEALRYESRFPNGETQITPITMKHAAGFRNMLQTSLWELRKEYGKALAYRRKLRPGLGSNGHWPMVLQAQLASMFSHLNFDWAAVPLFRDRHIILNTAVMSLFATYSREQKLYRKMEGTMLTRLTASDHMRQTLNPFTENLIEKGFSFDDFPFTRWATVLSIARVKTSVEERKDLLATLGPQLIAEATYFRNFKEAQ